MARLRLRTQLLVANLLIICALVGAILLVVRHTVRSEIADQVQQGTNASLVAFESVQQERDTQLARTAAMLSELPTLKALMTTRDAVTIQDASDSFWKLAGTQLFVLAAPAPDEKILGLHSTARGWQPGSLSQSLSKSIELGEDAAWWYGDGRLYRVALRTITAGEGADARQLGILAVGYEVDAGVAQQLANVSGSQIALTANDKIIASTISPSDAVPLQIFIMGAPDTQTRGREWKLGSTPYQVASVNIHEGAPVSVKCYVMMSLEPANSFLRRLNWTILVLAISAILLAAILLRFVSSTITRPLDNLVSGVRALAKGDYTYSITPEAVAKWLNLATPFRKCGVSCRLPKSAGSPPNASPRLAARPRRSHMTCGTTSRRS